MRIFRFLFLGLIVSLVGCKSQHSTVTSEPSWDEYSEAVPAEETSTPTPEPEIEPTPAPEPEAIPVYSKEESVSAAEGEASDLQHKKFFIIIGSFKSIDNAQNFKTTLESENFNPGILVNDNGLYRVCVDSYNDEGMARARISEIRTNYDNYKDVWLLVQKN